MQFKRVCNLMIAGILLLLSSTSFSQEPKINFNKANSIQIVSYKPQKAKAGKDGSERVVIIRLFNGPKSGKNGKDGKAGPNLSVNVSAVNTADSNMLRLIVTQIAENKKQDTFYVNPRYGQIKLITDGGDGGNGGAGETGGGSPGTGGKGGMGGQIEVFFNADALSHVNCKCLVFSNAGGRGGWSGENYGTAAQAGNKGAPVYLKDEVGKILATR